MNKDKFLVKDGNRAEWGVPEGYPSKSVQTITLMEEQELAFAAAGSLYFAALQSLLDIVGGQTYTVKWDGTEHECVCHIFNGKVLTLGNLSIIGMGSDTGEPFCYASAEGSFTTFDTSARHTISVKTIAEAITPIDEKYLPTIPADKLPTIPADKLPTIPVIEFTTNISENIANATQPSFAVSNLSYSEIYSIVEKRSFQIKDSDGYYYSPIRCSINSSGTMFVDLLVIGTPTTYANLACSPNKTNFYRNNWWQIEATQK